MKCTTLGIDLPKQVFQLHGVDERGQVAVQKRVTRAKLRETVAQLPPCVMGMEVMLQISSFHVRSLRVTTLRGGRGWSTFLFSVHIVKARR
jgi:hypothetical protein